MIVSVIEFPLWLETHSVFRLLDNVKFKSQIVGYKDYSYFVKDMTIYIKRKNANNNRQTSLWEKVVLLGLRIKRFVGFK